MKNVLILYYLVYLSDPCGIFVFLKGAVFDLLTNIYVYIVTFVFYESNLSLKDFELFKKPLQNIELQYLRCRQMSM